MITIVTTAQINTDEILKKPYTRRLVPDETQGYTASIQEFPGCFAEGDTAEDALRNLDNAAASWITVSILNGREVRDPIDFAGCSGKVALRIPRSLHKEVAELAELENCSINQVLTAAIASYVSGKHVMHQVAQSLKSFMPTANHINIDATISLSWQGGLPSKEIKQISASSTEILPATFFNATAHRFLTDKPQYALEMAHG